MAQGSEAPAGEAGADVFLSYAREDQVWARWVVSQLAHEGLRTVWDEDFPPGSSFVTLIDQAIATSRCTVVLLSPSYMESPWAQRERDAALALATEGRSRLVPVKLRDPVTSPLLLAIDYVDLTSLGAERAARALRSGVRAALGQAPASRASPPTSVAFPPDLIHEAAEAGRSRHRDQFVAASDAAYERRKATRGSRVAYRPVGSAQTLHDRAPERQTLDELLAAPRTRAVTVLGPAGIGKTELASAVVAELSADPAGDGSSRGRFEGVVNLSTRTGAGITLHRVVTGCSQILGGDREQDILRLWSNGRITVEEKVETFLELVRDTPLVILLDHVDDLLAPQTLEVADPEIAELITQHVVGPSEVRLLLTSRVPPRLTGTPSVACRSVELTEGLPVPDGIMLLRELAPALTTVPSDRLAVAVEAVHGYPRALELLISVGAVDDTQALESYQRSFSLEKVSLALFEDAYATLSSDERLVLAAVAVFERPVPVAAVAAVVLPQCGGLDAGPVIDSLAARRLLRVSPDTGMVTLHPFDREIVARAPVRDGTSARLDDLAADYWQTVRVPAALWRDSSDLEPHLQEFHHRIRGGDWNGAGAVLAEIDQHYRVVTWDAWHHQERRDRLEGRLTDRRQLLLHDFARGVIATALGRPEDALSHFEAALRAARAHGEARIAREATGWMGVALRGLGRLDEALALVRRTIDDSERADDVWAVGWWSGEISLVHLYRGDVEAALRAAVRVQECAARLDDEELNGRANDVLAVAHFRRGDLEEAAACAEQAMRAYRLVNVPDGQAFVRNVQGMVCLTRGAGDPRQLDDAERAFTDTATWGGQMGNPRVTAIGHLHAALTAIRRGDPASAVVAASRAAEVLPEAAELRRAVEAVQEAAAAFTREDPVAGARALLRYAQAAVTDGDLHAPAEWAAEALRRAAGRAPEMQAEAERLMSGDRRANER